MPLDQISGILYVRCIALVNCSVLIITAVLLAGFAPALAQPLPTGRLDQSEYRPSRAKPGGIILGPAMPRAFHYGGRHAVRDLDSYLHVTWVDPTYTFNYYSRSLDTLGFTWSSPYNVLDSIGVDAFDSLPSKLAIDPVTGWLYLLMTYKLGADQPFIEGITRSVDAGDSWSPVLDVGAGIGIQEVDLRWGTMTIGSDQWLHLVMARDSSALIYTSADLSAGGGLDLLHFRSGLADDIPYDTISLGDSGIVFQGTIVVDRANEPHIIFSGDGGGATFGDKTPYHSYLRRDLGVWGPMPPQRLSPAIENIWGIPELVFDADNRGYYFFCDNELTEMIFGTWEPPLDRSDTLAFGTLNATGTVYDGDGLGGIGLTTENFSGIGITSDDYLYLPNADVDDANDIVYLAANTNGYGSGGGGDIVLLSLENATSFAGLPPDQMDWQMFRWITEDGIGLGDIGVDLVYDPSSSHIDLFWSAAGPETNLAVTWGHGFCSGPDIEAWKLDYNFSGYDEVIHAGDTLIVAGTIKNNGCNSVGPTPVTITVFDTMGSVVFLDFVLFPPLGAGQVSAMVEFGPYTIDRARQILNIEMSIDNQPYEGEYNYRIGTSFFVYPDLDWAVGFDSFNDTAYVNFPVYQGGGSRDGDYFATGGRWHPTTPYETGGWAVIDSSYEFGDIRDEYSSTWRIADGDLHTQNAYIRHMMGVRNDTAFGDITVPAGLTTADYAQPQNEVLLSPVYHLSGSALYSFEWEDDIGGTDGESNFPLHAWVDYAIDGGMIWQPVYHRSDLAGSETTINGQDGYHVFDLPQEVSLAESVQFRFWWRNLHNDGSFATWTVDNVFLIDKGREMGLSPAGEDRALPQRMELTQNYPNPFNPVTTIPISLPVSGFISFKVYNLRGELVATLFDGTVSAGKHLVQFNGSNLASGIYIVTLASESGRSSRKVLLLK